MANNQSDQDCLSVSARQSLPAILWLPGENFVGGDDMNWPTDVDLSFWPPTLILI
jgi:hypothetical protein